MSELINIINGVPTPFTDEEKAQREKDIAEYNSDASKLSRIKRIRQQFLEQTDWWVLRGNMTDAQTQYRQKLRDIPADYDSSKYDELLARDEQSNLTHTVWSKP
jgi:hypothetical protein|tara:strand:- start:11 stop:322 length:312 start_codon:yes stop_codon:yes gene_type:complete